MKKFLSLILSILLIFTLTVPAFASGTVKQTCPTIYVHGFAGSKICADKNDPSTMFTLPSSDELLESVKKDLLPALLTYVATENGDPFAYELCEIVNTVFAGYFNNPDGTAKDSSGAYMAYPSSVSKNSNLIFSYDWRSDPFVAAEELNKFIEYVISKSGSDKVALRCHSLGSVIGTTYLRTYGNDKIMGVVFDSPALFGITYIGELLCGNPEIAGDALLNGLKDLLGENEYNQLISSTLDILALAGIVDDLGGFLNTLIKKTAPILYKETLVPLFAYWPAAWAMCPDKYIDKAMEHVFTTYCTGEEHSVLKEKIERYNIEVRANKIGTLLDFDKNGRVAVISRYGYSALPVSPSWDVLTDTVVDTKHSSFGATTAPVGTSFSKEELEGKDMSLISPDRTVDASTCLFPEKTWFIKNIKHDRTDITKPLHIQFLFGEEEATVENQELSRFMIFDVETEILSEDKNEYKEPVKETETTSLLLKLMRFFTSIFNFIANLFKGK